MNQPVQTLYLDAYHAKTLLSDDTGNESVYMGQVLTFTLKAIVYISGVDF